MKQTIPTPLFLLFLLLISASLVSSCGNNGDSIGPSDDDDPMIVTYGDCEYPLKDALAAGSYTIETGELEALGDPAYGIFGFEFTATKDGRITEVGVMIPDQQTVVLGGIVAGSNPPYEKLADFSITPSPGTWTYVPIDPPLEVVDGQDFLNGQSLRTTQDDSAIFYNIQDFGYPLTVGNIVLQRYAYNIDTDPDKIPEPKDPQIFPLMNGFVDFCFQPAQ